MSNRMKKILTAFLLLSLSGIVAAFDTGLEMSNTGGWKNTGTGDWFTDHKLTGWMQIPFDNSNTNSLSIEGSVYASKPANEDSLSFFINLDLFRFSLLPVSAPGIKIALDAGRIPASDAAGFIINQTVDGAEMHGTFSFGNIDFLAGYTGLLNVRKDGTFMSSDDYADGDTESFYALGSSRVVGKVTLQFPGLIGNTDAIIEGSGQYDIRRFLESDPDQVVDTAYGTLLLTGTVVDSFFCTVSGTYQTGVLEDATDSYSENSILASIRFDYYPAASNQLFAQFIYSPPEGDFFTGFLPISFQSAGTLFTSGYSNLMRASAGWNFNPARYINFDLGGKAFLYSEVPDDKDSMYQGAEITGGSTIRATSDLRFRLDGAFFLPYEEDLQYQASLKAIFDL